MRATGDPRALGELVVEKTPWRAFFKIFLG
jgi:hypothetical protein